MTLTIQRTTSLGVPLTDADRERLMLEGWIPPGVAAGIRRAVEPTGLFEHRGLLVSRLKKVRARLDDVEREQRRIRRGAERSGVENRADGASRGVSCS